jgi:hypothetical protein
MAGRGEYSAIHTALVDAPDFQALSPDARLAFYTLKMILGPSGIEVVRCFVAQMGQLTGLSEDRLRPALDELVRGNWLAQQGDIVWLRNGLRFNPGCNLANDKHRVGVVRHLEGLPRLQIVNAFCKHYDLSEIAVGMGIEWVSVPYGIQVEVKGNGNGISSVSKETGDESPEVEEPKERTDDEHRARVAPLIREHLWLGSKTPVRVLDKNPGWKMGNEITIAAQWAKEYGWEVVLGVIPFLRRVVGAEPDVPLSLLWFNAKEKRAKLSEAIGLYQRQVELDALRKPSSFDLRRVS